MLKKRFCAAFLAFFLLAAPCSSIFGSKIDFSDKTVIQTVQTKLNAAGFDCGVPDGVAGTKTKQAIKDFREKQGLAAGEQIDADLFNALMLDENGLSFVDAAKKAVGGLLKTGEALDEVILSEFDLYVAVDPGTNAQDEEAMYKSAAELSESLVPEIMKLEDYDYLWDTITLVYGELPGIITKKEEGEGITAAVRIFLNDYESFMNEYADFLVTYDDTDFTQQQQYLSLMRKAAEYKGKAEEMDASEMTETDRQFFDSVMERVNKRLPAE